MTSTVDRFPYIEDSVKRVVGYPGDILPIAPYGTRVLHVPAQAVSRFDDDLQTLIRKMFRTMHANDGVGLAAPQIGVGLRVAVVDVRPITKNPSAKYILINPVITASEGKQRGKEGCLSLAIGAPGMEAEVERALEIAVSMRGVDGGEQNLVFEGFEARAVQHEIDHLDGKLYVDRISRLKRGIIVGKFERLRKAGRV